MSFRPEDLTQSDQLDGQGDNLASSVASQVVNLILKEGFRVAEAPSTASDVLSHNVDNLLQALQDAQILPTPAETSPELTYNERGTIQIQHTEMPKVGTVETVDISNIVPQEISSKTESEEQIEQVQPIELASEERLSDSAQMIRDDSGRVTAMENNNWSYSAHYNDAGTVDQVSFKTSDGHNQSITLEPNPDSLYGQTYYMQSDGGEKIPLRNFDVDKDGNLMIQSFEPGSNPPRTIKDTYTASGTHRQLQYDFELAPGAGSPLQVITDTNDPSQVYTRTESQINGQAIYSDPEGNSYHMVPDKDGFLVPETIQLSGSEVIHEQPAEDSHLHSRSDGMDSALQMRQSESDESGEQTQLHSRGADGSLDRGDQAKDKAPVVTEKDVEAQHKHLEKLAEEQGLKGDEKQRFLKDMATFEERMKGNPEAIVKTYQEIVRIMEAKGNHPLEKQQRLNVAEQVMHHAAHPTSISQGSHNTCNVATVEVRTYSQHPEKAAKLVADMATTGKYTAPDGTKVSVPEKSLRPHDEAVNNPPGDGQRDLASQIFEVTAVNVHYAKVDPTGKLHYEQAEPVKGANPPDTGERMMMGDKPQKDSDGKFINSPGLTTDQIVDVSNAITGQKETDVLLAYDKYDDGEQITKIESEEALNEKLAKLKEQGKLPIIVLVDSNNEPFHSDSGAGAAGGSGGAHVVTITDYTDKPPPPKVSVDNQWASGADHLGKPSISVHDMFMSMRDSKDGRTILDMSMEVQENRRNGQVDTAKEIDLLRHRHDSGNLNDQDYAKAVLKAVKEAQERWDKQAKEGTLDASEHDKGVKEMLQVVGSLPPTDRLSLLQSLHGHKDISADVYDDQIFQATFYAYSKWNQDAAVKQPNDAAKQAFEIKQQSEKDAYVMKLREMLDQMPKAERDQMVEWIKDAMLQADK
ncbi:MAG: hypothetical protein HY711_07230 [Candidatus Melainabacteria bacterium]|nr:hypothetical protein [Candidatus Melainabacteria bacterium]